LDFCGKGPAMVVYPEGVFYGNVQLADVSEITESHLIGNEIVSRLQIG
jgi:(2Fe-2S) ferredoxin